MSEKDNKKKGKLEGKSCSSFPFYFHLTFYPRFLRIRTNFLESHKQSESFKFSFIFSKMSR